MSGDLFTASGVWLKGNLHCHTTNSDGLLAPQEVVDLYHGHGYDFLSLTDHEKITEARSERLLLIPGTEVVTGQGALGDSYHVVAINVEDNDAVQKHRLESIDSLFEYAAGVGGVAFVAHPYWSRLTTTDLSDLRNCCGVEIYNTGCDLLVAKGYSTVHWDNLLVQGKMFHGFAVDDAHWYPLDSTGGWIWVKAQERSLAGLLESIRRGRFYSTMGPTIENLSHSDGRFEAKFSPVKRVDVVSQGGIGFSASVDAIEQVKAIRSDLVKVAVNEAKDGSEEIEVEVGARRACLNLRNGSITYLSVEGVPFQRYLRLEITDASGKKAWSNAEFL